MAGSCKHKNEAVLQKETKMLPSPFDIATKIGTDFGPIFCASRFFPPSFLPSGLPTLTPPFFLALSLSLSLSLCLCIFSYFVHCSVDDTVTDSGFVDK
jgi:hypothetical protein